MPKFPNQEDVDVLPADARAPADTGIRDVLTREMSGEAAEGSSGGKSETAADVGDGTSPGSASETAPGGRPRDASGKFQKAAGEVAPPTPEIPKFADQKAAPAAPAATEATDDPGAKPPASWKPEKAALWDSIPAEARPYIHEREKQLQDGFQRAAQVREVAESVLNEFTPYQHVLQQEGATPVTAMRALLQTAYALRTAEPEYRKALFLQLAQQYGVDFNSGFDQNLAKAQADAAQLRLQQMEQQTFAAKQQESQVGQAISEFASTHEFFPELRETMGRLLNAGVAPDLETAYQQASQLVPQVKTALEARQVALAKSQQMSQNRERAARATQGGGAPGAGSYESSGSPGKSRSLRDEIEAAWGTDG